MLHRGGPSKDASIAQLPERRRNFSIDMASIYPQRETIFFGRSIVGRIGRLQCDLHPPRIIC